MQVQLKIVTTLSLNLIYYGGKCNPGTLRTPTLRARRLLIHQGTVSLTLVSEQAHRGIEHRRYTSVRDLGGRAATRLRNDDVRHVHQHREVSAEHEERLRLVLVRGVHDDLDCSVGSARNPNPAPVATRLPQEPLLVVVHRFELVVATSDDEDVYFVARDPLLRDPLWPGHLGP